MQMKQVLSCVAISLLIASARCHAGDVDLSPDALAKRARAAFTVAWTVSHDTKADAAEATAKIYADGWPGSIVWAMAVMPKLSQFPGDAGAEDIIAGKHGKVTTEELWIMSQDLCLEYFGKHIEGFEKVLARDIAGGPNEQTKAGQMLSEFRRAMYNYKRATWNQGRAVLKEEDARQLSALAAELFPVAQKRAAELKTIPAGDPLVYIFREIDDPRAIALLIEKGKNSLSHFEVLRSLQRNRPADAALVGKLTDPSADIRWRAIYALAESLDAALTPRVVALLGDGDARVRSEALSLAGLLQPKFTAEMDVAVKGLLKDADESVRKACIRVLTFRQDAACAPALLTLLREGLQHLAGLDKYTNQEFMEFNVLVEDMERLTESRFGYDVSAWPAATAGNKAALEKFAAWIEEKGKK